MNGAQKTAAAAGGTAGALVEVLSYILQISTGIDLPASVETATAIIFMAVAGWWMHRKDGRS